VFKLPVLDINQLIICAINPHSDKRNGDYKNNV